MFRDLLTIIIVLGVALGLGSWSAQEVTREFSGFGQVTVDGWRAQPFEGSAEADAYTRARIARQGEFVLGAAEGLRFQRDQDNEDQPLTAHCIYRLTGTVSDSRAWGLSVGEVTPDNEAGDQVALTTSATTFYEPDGSLDIVLAKRIQPGNWHALPVDNLFELTLTLYDTSVVSGSGLTVPSLPMISRVRCDDR